MIAVSMLGASVGATSGQTLTYNPQKGTWAPRGAYVVTAKIPERNGEFEYRIRSAIEDNERMARESELQAMNGE